MEKNKLTHLICCNVATLDPHKEVVLLLGDHYGNFISKETYANYGEVLSYCAYRKYDDAYFTHPITKDKYTIYAQES